MLSKILYRCTLPTVTDPPTPPSTASHPHSSLTHAGISESSTHNPSNVPNRKRNFPDGPEKHYSYPDSNEGGCPSNNPGCNPGDCNSDEKELNPHPENVRSSISKSQIDDSSSCAPVKVSLGDITEVKGVIFDMDGTLTVPVLNCVEMIKKIGLKPTDDILPTVQKLPPKERAKAMAIIEECEREGVKNMKLQPGVLDVLLYLSERNIKRAVMTRNARMPTNAFLKRLSETLSASIDKYPLLDMDSMFSEIITREFEPCKPDPASVFHICKQWSLEPRQVMVVGDDKTDMVCGLRAGVGVNILLRNERNMKQIDFSHFTVETLTDIIPLTSSLMTVPYKEVP